MVHDIVKDKVTSINVEGITAYLYMKGEIYRYIWSMSTSRLVYVHRFLATAFYYYIVIVYN